MSEIIERIAKTLPKTPGVYVFYSINTEILYIGKAIRLRDRVLSYNNTTSLNAAKRAMVQEIHDIKVYPCDSEIEALILESNLIKKHSPRFNVLLKDDKSYAYLAWTKEEFPRLFITYKSVLDTKGDELHSLGPFINAEALRASLRILRKIFPYRSCKKLPSTPCLYYKLNLCKAPCIAAISTEQYRENLTHILEFMKGNKKTLIRELTKKMHLCAESEEFEKAAELRNQLYSLEQVALHKGVIKSQNSQKSKHMQELQTLLNFPKLPKRIEGFDSSHFHGASAVVSMVVFENGRPQSSNYRRFKIKEAPDGGDDFYNLHQALTRRFHKPDWPIPDLIIIDGGKGQLHQALEAQKNGLIQFQSIPIISLAKREEEVFLPGQSKSILFPRSSKALQLIQSVRDESHRFAVQYHRKLREDIPLKKLKKNLEKSK